MKVMLTIMQEEQAEPVPGPLAKAGFRAMRTAERNVPYASTFHGRVAPDRMIVRA